MIYKKTGVYLIKHLQVVHLFEADYNFVIDFIFSQQVLYSGIKNKKQSTLASSGPNWADNVSTLW
jgi:hypothetical protein